MVSVMVSSDGDETGCAKQVAAAKAATANAVIERKGLFISGDTLLFDSSGPEKARFEKKPCGKCQ